jgi:NAD(P)H-dependent flavin oxidoreductase YrpB (nitropropane dioxygenase family)
MKPQLPRIIQGGMGVGVSSPKLAQAVAKMGQLGVVSGTAVAVTLARRLQHRNVSRTIMKALAAFPFQDMVERILDRYHRAAKPSRLKYIAVPMPRIDMDTSLVELTVVANYVEVYQAKQGHKGMIGINLLEKLQVPTVASLYGAILAGVDVVLMGAGIPIRIPWLLDELQHHRDVSFPIHVTGDLEQKEFVHFSPKEITKETNPTPLKRPQFLAIVSSGTLATRLHRSDFGSPDGFVVETPIAGGHNAPPRGNPPLNEQNEPQYGPKDTIDLSLFRQLGLPFWLAGGYGTPDALHAAIEQGAQGIQVGTAFAFCEESGMKPSIRKKVIHHVLQGDLVVRTDGRASPTGFPFKIVELQKTNGIPVQAKKRRRVCDLGYLREPYRKADGSVGYRCASEPIDDYIKKGGTLEDTKDRLCLCNGLVSAIGLPQKRADKRTEKQVITAGDDLVYLARYMPENTQKYSAKDVIAYILNPHRGVLI